MLVPVWTMIIPAAWCTTMRYEGSETPSPPATPRSSKTEAIWSTDFKAAASSCELKVPGSLRYRSSVPSAIAPIRTGNANTARTPDDSTSLMNAGHR